MSHWYLTTRELSFLAPIGVILGAAIALVGQRLTAKLTLDEQRKLAEDQRLWDRRAETYVRGLNLTQRLRVEVGTNRDEVWGSEELETLAEILNEHTEVTPLMYAFAHAPVRKAWLSYTIAVLSLGEPVADLGVRADAAKARHTAGEQQLGPTLSDWMADYRALIARVEDVVKTDVEFTTLVPTLLGAEADQSTNRWRKRRKEASA
jgi:hypothetical protein